MAFGLWPVVRATRSTRLSIQQAADRAQLQRTFAARITVIAQLALCTVLLIGAGLLLRTVINLRFQDLGFDRNVLLVAISPRQAGYSEPAAPMLVQRIRESLSAVPGVQAVGVSGHALMDFTHYFISGTDHLTTDQNVVLPGGRWTLAAVGPGFFDAIGMSLVTGRTFDERDALPSANVVIINRSLATFVFGDQNPIGRGIRFNPRAAMLSVVGVVNDNKQVSPRDRGLGVLYLPMRDFAHVVLAVRTASSPSAAAPVIRHHLASIAGDVPVDTVHTIREVLDTAIGQERLMSAISLALATLVITIGCIGLYALMSYDVARRSRELGIRLALGATGRKMVTLVLRDAALLIVPALAIGMPLGVAVSRQLSSQLYGVDTGDPSTLTFAVVVLALVAVLAALRPARKACRIDPIFLLRHE